MPDAALQQEPEAGPPAPSGLRPWMTPAVRSLIESSLGRSPSQEEWVYLGIIADQASLDSLGKTLAVHRTSGLSLADICELSCHYGENWSTIYALSHPRIPAPLSNRQFLHFEKKHREHLIRIARHVSEPAIGIFHQNFFFVPAMHRLFSQHPELVAQLFERFDGGAIPMMKAFGSRAVNLSPEDAAFYSEFKARVGGAYLRNFGALLSVDGLELAAESHRNAILEIAGVLREASGDFLRSMTGRQLEECPSRLALAAKFLGAKASAMLEVVGDDIVTMTSETFGDLIRLYRSTQTVDSKLPSCLAREGRGPELCRALHGFLALHAAYGSEEASALMRAFGYDAAHFNTAQHLELKGIRQALIDDDAADSVVEVLGHLSPAIFKRSPGLYGEIVGTLGYDAPDVVEAMAKNPRLAVMQRDLFMYACGKMGHFFSDVIPHIPATLPEPLAKFVRRGIDHIGADIGYVLEVTPHDVLLEHRFSYYQHMEHYGSSFIPLFSLFGHAKYFELEAANQDTINRIIELSPNGAPDIFRFVPLALWDDPRLHAAIGIYEEATGREYAARGDRFFEQETEELTALRLRCKQEFGIRHFYRLCRVHSDGSLDTSILERNLKYLEAGDQLDRPFYVRVFPRSDWNGAFTTPVAPSEELRNSHVVFYAESGSVDETTFLLQRLALLRGIDVDGEPLRPLEHVTVSSHANNEEIVPGFRSPEERRMRSGTPPLAAGSVKKSDGAVLEAWTRYVAPGGSMTLDGCLTALGGVGMNNVATSVKREGPHVRIFASRDPVCSIDTYLTGEQGKIIGVKFKNNPRGTVEFGLAES